MLFRSVRQDPDLEQPNARGGAPRWDTKPFPKADRAARFVALASGDPRDAEALPIRADARVLGATLKAGDSAEYALGAGRHLYLVAAGGAVEVNGVALEPGDGAAVRDEAVVRVEARDDAELVLVDA